VNISGFTVINSGGRWGWIPYYTGIMLNRSHYCTITGNNISFNDMGLSLYHSNGTTVSDNVVANNLHWGVKVHHGHSNVLAGNFLSQRDNIVITHSRGNSVVDNSMSTRDWGNYGIYLSYSDSNLIRNNTASGNESGIYMFRSSNNEISSNNVTSNKTVIELVDSHDNTISDNIAWEGLSGISIDHSRYNTLTGNILVGNGLTINGHLLDHWITHSVDASNTLDGRPIYFWKNVVGGQIPSGAGQVILVNCSNVVIEGQSISARSIAIQLSFSSHVTIANSTITQNNRAALYLYHSHNNTIVGNDISQIHGDAVYAWKSEDNSIVDNMIADSAQGVWFLHCNRTRITGNNFSGSGSLSDYGDRIRVSDSQDSIVSDNYITRGWMGIDFEFSDNITIINNTVAEVGYGVFLTSLHNSNISNNRIYSNTMHGIVLAHGRQNTIANNTIWNNTEGIGLYRTDENLVVNNTIRENDCGVRIGSDDPFGGPRVGFENRIYHNLFIDNVVQAEDDWGVATWDNGYPSGGNYWSDYTGQDWRTGPNQDEIGSDGIGDTHYEGRSTAVVDRYPLMLFPADSDESVSNLAWFWVATPIVAIILAVALVFYWRGKKKAPEE
jgi:parallel beta-helix repeat protein